MEMISHRPDSGDAMVWRKIPDEELFAGFSKYLVQEGGRSKRTAEAYIHAVRAVSKYSHKSAHKIGAEGVEDVRATLQSGLYKPAGNRHIVVGTRRFHLWGVVEGYWKRNGLAELQTPKVPRNVLPPLRDGEAFRILALCETPYHFRIAYPGLYAGLRISESASLDEDNWRDGWLYIMGKGVKKRRIPVHPELERKREVILSKHPSKRVLEVTWCRFRDRYGFKNMEGNRATTHTLRRTLATTMYDEGRGAPWEVCARILGHGEDVTASYVQISDAQLIEAISPVEYRSGEPEQLSFF